MDQNSPEDIFTLGSYLSRDQYGDRPLVYGQLSLLKCSSTAKATCANQGPTKAHPFISAKKKLAKKKKTLMLLLAERISTFMHRTCCSHVCGVHFMRNRITTGRRHRWLRSALRRCGETLMIKMPSQMDNIRFFLSYQCNFMYWRYFMWNFAGRAERSTRKRRTGTW